MSREIASLFKRFVALLAFGLNFSSSVLEAQTLPYAEFYNILPASSGISGVQAIASASGAALAADILIGQSLVNNYVEELAVNGTQPEEILRQSRFILSGQRSQGIISVNQESGNLNNQTNVFVVSGIAGLGGANLSEATLVSGVRSEGNTVVSSGGDREDRIQLSFFEASGVVGINQSAGSLNQQSNLKVLTEATGSVEGLFRSLSYSALEEVVANNSVSLEPVSGEGLRRDFMHASFVGFKGLAQTNQSAGDLNVVQNGMLISLNGFQF